MTSLQMARRSLLVGSSALFVAACSSKSSSSASSSQGLDRYRAAQNKLAAVSSYHVKMTSSGVPTQESSLSGGEGDVVIKTSAFSGTAQVNTVGRAFNAGIVSIGTAMWARLNNKGNYIRFDPSLLHVPAPSSLFGARTGVLAVPGLSADLKAAGTRVVDGQKLDIYRGTVDPVKATKALGFGQSRTNYTVEVGINSSDEIHVITVQGPFFASANATYTVTFSKFGEKVTITAPATK